MDFGLSVPGLILPAFVAGMLTFLAPCTLPLVPGYLAFISGVSLHELQQNGKKQLRSRVFTNGLWYVLGFSLVFIILGSVFGSVGGLLAPHRLLLARLGGIIIIFFGFYLIGLVRLPAFLGEYKIHVERFLRPGHKTSSFLFGATFAFGWTPCIGPILGSVLLLASQSATAGRGAFLLFIFSLGLAIPFLILAWGVAGAAHWLHRFNKSLRVISIIGGVLLIFLGVLLLTDNFYYWLQLAYRLFGFIRYDSLLQYM